MIVMLHRIVIIITSRCGGTLHSSIVIYSRGTLATQPGETFSCLKLKESVIYFINLVRTGPVITDRHHLALVQAVLLTLLRNSES